MAKCLYNGVELPALPEWDKENYPYATLHYVKGFRKYWLFVFPKTAYVFESNGSLFFGGKDDDDVLVDAYQYNCQPGGDSWGGPTYWEHANSFIATLDGSESVAFRDVWANFDVEYNGTLYLAASDPIPVSPVQIDPAALLETFFTGQAIRRSR